MKRIALPTIALAGILACSGCQHQQQTATDNIREGIRQHLASLNTLNLSAMDMNLTNVAVNGDSAQAQVEFVPKTGAPAGATMRVSYSLEKRGEQWVVVKTNTLGGAINHPGAGTNPHGPAQGPVHGELPNFREILPSASPNGNGALPPGHPQVPPPAQKSSP